MTTPEEAAMAKAYGVRPRAVQRVGMDRLNAMSDDARRVVLCMPKISVSACELHRGGLRARGFKVRNNHNDGNVVPEERTA